MPTKKTTKVPVTVRALLARINRNLAPAEEAIRACRPSSRSWHELGDFYRIDRRANSVIAMHVDLEALGRELGILHGYEALAGEP